MTKNKIYSFKFKPENTMKNEFIKVEAKDKREAKRKILKRLGYINKRYTEVYEMEANDGQ
tara:strand:+ start:425 stop:604 length:180 start_codon:yes stop_codon:yes gene_type:complete